MRNKSSLRTLVLASCLGAMTTFQASAGWVQQLFYFPIDPAGSTSVAALTNSPSFPNGPSESPGIVGVPLAYNLEQTVQTPNTLMVGLNGAAENYGSMIQGYLIAPQTGTYDFWISSDDSSEFYLSTDSSMANMRLKAFIDGYSDPYQWTKFPSQKTNVVLTAGQTYFFRILYKEGGGGDHFELGWRRPDNVIERPMPVKYIQRFTPADAGFGNFDYNAAVTGMSPVIDYPYPGWGDSLSIEERRPVELYVNVSGTQPMSYYRWYKDGNLLGTETMPFISFPQANTSQNGFYRCEVSNGIGTPKTIDIALFVYDDTTRPVPVSAATAGGTNTLVVSFSEPVDPATVTTNSVKLDGGLSVLSAVKQYGTNEQVLIFTVSGSVSAATTVTFWSTNNTAGVSDMVVGKNRVAHNTVIPILRTDGLLNQLRYANNKTITPGATSGDFQLNSGLPSGTSGNLLSTIIFNTNFTTIQTQAVSIFFSSNYVNNTPIDSFVVPDTVVRYIGPENYGMQLIGYLTAPITGNYVFYMSSDDQGALWLSSDENPANRRVVCWEFSNNGSFNWSSPDRRNSVAATGPYNGAGQTQNGPAGQQLFFPPSIDPTTNCNHSYNIVGPIQLVAGQRYFFEGLAREGTGGDFLQVAWKYWADGQPEPAAPANNGNIGNPGIISGQYFSSYYAVPPLGPSSLSLGPPGITTQATNFAVGERVPITLSAFNPSYISGTPTVRHGGAIPYVYQWFENGVALPDGNGDRITLRLGRSQNGYKYHVVIRNNHGEATSQLINIDVTPDTNAPVVTRVVTGPEFNQVVIDLNDQGDITPNTLTNKANYALSAIGGASAVSISNLVIRPNYPNYNILVQLSGNMTVGGQYQLITKNLRDTAEVPNFISAVGVTNLFRAPVLTRGWLAFEEFRGMAGNNTVDDYLNGPRAVYKDWDYRGWINRTSFRPSDDNNGTTRVYPGQQAYYGSRNRYDTYAVRMFGFFTPYVSGPSTFFIRGDDGTQVFVNNQLAANANAIANQSWRHSNGGPSAGGSAAPSGVTNIIMNAGTAYPFEAILKENTGGDYYEVAMLEPGQTVINDGGLNGYLAATWDRHLGSTWGTYDNYATEYRGVDIRGNFLSCYAGPDGAWANVTNNLPASTNVNENQVYDFTITTGGATWYNSNHPRFHQWQFQKPGASQPWVDIRDANYPSNSIYFSAADTGGKLRCLVTVPGYTTNTTEMVVNVTVLDTNKPSVVSVVIDESLAGAAVNFSEPMDPVTALNRFNYIIGVDSPTNATMSADGKTVWLSFATPLTANTSYTLNISNLRDRASAPNTLNTSVAAFTSSKPVANKIKAEVWFLPSSYPNNITALTNHPAFIANQPNETHLVNNWLWVSQVSRYAGSSAPNTDWNNNNKENYGARLTGLITVPTTGDYVFAVCADDAAGLYLSTDTDPRNKRMICAERGATAWRNYDQTGNRTGNNIYFPQTAGLLNTSSNNLGQLGVPNWPGATRTGAIPLQTGKQYYMELLFKEGTGGDYVGVVMWPYGTTRPANNTTPMAASGPAFVPPDLTTVNLTGIANRAVFDSQGTNVSVTATPVPSNLGTVTYQWQAAPSGSSTYTNLPGATATTYNLALAELDYRTTGRKYQVIANYDGRSYTSSVATVNVQQPGLTVRKVNSTNVAVSWPAGMTNWVIQQNATNIVDAASWSTNGIGTIATAAGVNTITVTNAAGVVEFRLQNPKP